MCTVRRSVSTPARHVSSCSTDVCSWLVYKVVDIIVHRDTQHDAVIATGVITCSAVIISVMSAFPWVRKYVPVLEPHVAERG
jgi:hypothetical protein